jgi:hypothetical protein
MIGLLGSSPPIDGGLRYMRHGALNAVTEYHDWEIGYHEGDASRQKVHAQCRVRPGQSCRLQDLRLSCLKLSPILLQRGEHQIITGRSEHHG